MTKPKEKDGVTKYHVNRRVRISLTKFALANISTFDFVSPFLLIYCGLSLLANLQHKGVQASFAVSVATQAQGERTPLTTAP
jgi:hypothetical protein